jgi:enoyl-[acyl-carrier protein] reductase II
MYEGDLEEGELEIGQVSALIRDIRPAAEIVKDLWNEFSAALDNPLQKI